jgi:tRNA threonylcarbamoyladenosine biosynthesis protein TsaE
VTPSEGTEWRGIARAAAQTERLGAALAATVPPLSSGPAVVYLSGELGAGKTTLARGFLRERGVTDSVRSPTFTLLEPYELSDLVVVHMDLYRLRAPSELENLGARDRALPGHVWLIEWPERGSGYLPRPDLQIGLQVAPEGHPFCVRPCTPLGESWLARAVEFFGAGT